MESHFICESRSLVFCYWSVLYLSNHPSFSHYASSQCITDFLKTFSKKPLWIIKFYLIAHSGPFIGEAFNYLELRAWAGLIILFTYALAVRYVIVTKEKRLAIP